MDPKIARLVHSVRFNTLRSIGLAIVLLFGSSACSFIEPKLFYSEDKICAPNPMQTHLASLFSPAPIELHMLGVDSPVSYLHLFTEHEAEEIRIAGVSPLFGREFVVSIDNSKVLLEGDPRFLSHHQIHEISALAILVQQRLVQTPASDDPKDLECLISCNELKFLARCSNTLESLTVDFYDSRLWARYRFIAQRSGEDNMGTDTDQNTDSNLN